MHSILLAAAMFVFSIHVSFPFILFYFLFKLVFFLIRKLNPRSIVLNCIVIIDKLGWKSHIKHI